MADTDWHWEYDDFGFPIKVPDFVEPDPGAAAGPGVGVAPVSHTATSAGADTDWFEDDGPYDGWPRDPGGAAAGPGAGTAVPAELISNTTGQPVGNQPGGAGEYKIDYDELRKFAEEHDLNAEQILKWAAEDPDFAERYLQTHGKVNFGTYLKIKEFQASKLAAGTAFAQRSAATSAALRSTIAATSATDEANAAAFNQTRMV